MGHKLIKDLDEELWRKFVAYCKLKGVKVNKELENILKENLDKNFKKLLK
ncbi:MAG: hypothetical protein IH845_03205 [Nanoarchaeota archaeon]|nr:hypothetical protein [Nanoarchaeota archaeon]